MFLLYRTARALALLLAIGCTRPNPAYRPEVRPRPDAAEMPGPVDQEPPALDALLPADRALVADAGAAVVADGPADLAPADTRGPDAAPILDTAIEAPGADLPPGASADERTVTVTPGGMTTTYGGSGGQRYEDDCGTGRVLIGYRGQKAFYVDSTTLEYVISMTAVCGVLRLSPGATAVATVSQAMGSTRGRSEGDGDWEAICPDGSALVGFTGHVRAGTVENFQFRCATLSAAPAPPGAVNVGTASPLLWTGGRYGGSLMTTSCPPGQVGRGHILRVGSFIDAYQMTCGTPTAGP